MLYENCGDGSRSSSPGSGCRPRSTPARVLLHAGGTEERVGAGLRTQVGDARPPHIAEEKVEDEMEGKNNLKLPDGWTPQVVDRGFANLIRTLERDLGRDLTDQERAVEREMYDVRVRAGAEPFPRN